jgi:hypothetical protein
MSITASRTCSSWSGSSTVFGRWSVRTAYSRREARGRLALARGRPKPEQRVDHRVADEIHAVGRDSFGLKVLVAVAARGEEVRRQMIGQPAVDLLGHPGIEAAQAGLDVRDRVVLLDRDERAGQGGVHVADDEDHGGPDRVQFTLELGHDPGRLRRVGAGAHSERDVRLRELQLFEEDPRERRVVVLSRVDE